jgi:hypothetical protein
MQPVAAWRRGEFLSLAEARSQAAAGQSGDRLPHSKLKRAGDEEALAALYRRRSEAFKKVPELPAHPSQRTN